MADGAWGAIGAFDGDAAEDALVPVCARGDCAREQADPANTTAKNGTAGNRTAGNTALEGKAE